MSTLAIITLSAQGAGHAATLARELGDCDVFVHKLVPKRFAGTRFSAVQDLTGRIFRTYKGLVYILPCGVAVRSIAGLIRGKLVDPAVVVVDVGARHAVSLLSGHEGGANALALRVGNILHAEPVISTTTDAEKTLIVGIGCRRGTPAPAILAAIRAGLKRIKARPGDIRLLATVDLKQNEPGLIEAAERLGVGLRIISSGEIRSTCRTFAHSAVAERNVRLPAVAEPAALLAGRRTRLILRKTIKDGVTIAVARENSL